MIIWYKNYYLV